MIRLVASWFASVSLGLVVVGPLAALGVCSLVDIGPGGEARVSLFPAAMAVLDPYVWTCLRNSATTAGLAALAAIAAGVAVGPLVAGLRPPLRSALLVALAVLAASPPVVLAFGASGLLEAGGDAAWDALLRRAGFAARFLPESWSWIAWLAAAALPAAAAGAIACVQALGRLDPSWREAARLVGRGGARGWRRLAWPLLRPAMARTAGIAFAATLADPAAPMVLGVRRTLGYQMALAVTGDDPFPRLAALALIALVTASAARLALRIWSGPERPGPLVRDSDESQLGAGGSWSGVAAAGLIAAACGTIICATLLGLGLTMGKASGSLSRGAALAAILADPAMTRIIVRSIGLGVGVAALLAISRRLPTWLEASAGPGAAGRFRGLTRAVAAPPLVAGVVVLAVGRLATLGEAAGGGPPPSGWPSQAAAWLSGERFPLVAATIAVWLATVASPRAVRPAAPRRRGASRGPGFDAALLAGVGRGRARWLARPRSRGGRWGDAAAAAATAAADSGPAVLFAASAQAATLGPAVLLLRESPGGGASAAAFLAIAAWGLCVASTSLEIDRDRR